MLCPLAKSQACRRDRVIMVHASKALLTARLLDRRTERANDMRHPKMPRRLVQALEVDDVGLDARWRGRGGPASELHDAIEAGPRGEVSNALGAYEPRRTEDENVARRFHHPTVVATLLGRQRADRQAQRAPERGVARNNVAPAELLSIALP